MEGDFRVVELISTKILTLQGTSAPPRFVSRHARSIFESRAACHVTAKAFWQLVPSATLLSSAGMGECRNHEQTRFVSFLH